VTSTSEDSAAEDSADLEEGSDTPLHNTTLLQK
jgi:hypothetical protein